VNINKPFSLTEDTRLDAYNYRILTDIFRIFTWFIQFTQLNVVTDLQGTDDKSGLLTSHGNTVTRSYLLTLYVSRFHSRKQKHIRQDVYDSMISLHKRQSLNLNLILGIRGIIQ